MSTTLHVIAIDDLKAALADSGIDAGLRFETELAPIGGGGSPVKPAVYEGGRYQLDRRWADPKDTNPTDVVVIDNVPSQANRLESAVANRARELGVPELVLDLTGKEYAHLPAHLPRSLSSWRWPHRNADSYLLDSLIEGKPAFRHPMGRGILDATQDAAAALISWFPQSLLFGFWQSHLGKKRSQQKLARAWTSEIVGWNPAAPINEESRQHSVRTLGTKGDPYNLNIDGKIQQDENDRFSGWTIVPPTGKKKGSKKEQLSSLGHGQVPFQPNEAAPAGISFQRVTQQSIVSFAHLRRMRLGPGNTSEADAAARALLVALGVHAHTLAFGSSFHLRSGADLRPNRSSVTWLGGDGDKDIKLGDTAELFADAKEEARSNGVPLEGWDRPPVLLVPNGSLQNAIANSWPALGGPAS